jgi:hypothetical protein
VEFTVAPGEVGMSGIRVRHGVRTGAAVPVPVPAGALGAFDGRGEGAVGVRAAGESTCGNVARPAAAGSVGRYSGPRWPQADSAASAAAQAATRVPGPLHRIRGSFNIAKL